jgi:hypothetical protein
MDILILNIIIWIWKLTFQIWNLLFNFKKKIDLNFNILILNYCFGIFNLYFNFKNWWLSFKGFSTKIQNKSFL